MIKLYTESEWLRLGPALKYVWVNQGFTAPIFMSDPLRIGPQIQQLNKSVLSIFGGRNRKQYFMEIIKRT